MKKRLLESKKFADIIFILWAGGSALLTYSMIYALRKPYTAATFEGLDFFGIDYKSAVTTIQILGYLIAKLVGIKLISELKRENRFKFFVYSVVAASISLLGFALIPAPYNVACMFFNGLSLGCMWGVIFSFIEGRKYTDLLASMLSVSIVFSSGFAKSMGLYVMNDLGINQFWMPAVIAAVAFPILIFFAFVLRSLPNPTEEDVKFKSERVAIDGKQRKAIFRKYMPFLSLVFGANFLIMILRDIKEDFLVNIFDMTGHSSWLFAQLDTIVTLIILALFSVMIVFRKNIRAMMVLMVLVLINTLIMSYISLNYSSLNLQPITWLFIQSLSLYIPYLSFQSIFFDRYIATFRIKGNVGYFIAIIDFIGYLGTVTVLILKEVLKIETDWFALYNNLAAFVGSICTILFAAAAIVLIRQYKTMSDEGKNDNEQKIENNNNNNISISTPNVETSCI